MLGKLKWMREMGYPSPAGLEYSLVLGFGVQAA